VLANTSTQQTPSHQQFSAATFSIDRVVSPIVFYDLLIPITVHSQFDLHTDLQTIYNRIDFKSDVDCDYSCRLVLDLVERDFKDYVQRLSGVITDSVIHPILDFVDLKVSEILQFCTLFQIQRHKLNSTAEEQFIKDTQYKLDQLRNTYVTDKSSAYSAVCAVCEGMHNFCHDTSSDSVRKEIFKFCHDPATALENLKHKCVDEQIRGIKFLACDVWENFKNLPSDFCSLPSHSVIGWDASAVCGWPIVMTLANILGGVCHDDLNDIKASLRTQALINNVTSTEIKTIKGQLAILTNTTLILQDDINLLQSLAKDANDKITKLTDNVKSLFESLSSLNRKLYRYEQITYIYDAMNSYYGAFDRLLDLIYKTLHGSHNSVNYLGIFNLKFKIKEIIDTRDIHYNYLQIIEPSLRTVIKNGSLSFFIEGFLPAAKRDLPLGVKIQHFNVFKTNGTHCVGGGMPLYTIQAIDQSAYKTFKYVDTACLNSNGIEFCLSPANFQTFDYLNSMVAGDCSRWANVSSVPVNTTHAFVQYAKIGNSIFSGFLIEQGNQSMSVSFDEHVDAFYHISFDNITRISLTNLTSLDLNMTNTEFDRINALLDKNKIDFNENIKKISVLDKRLTQLIAEHDSLNAKFNDQVENLTGKTYDSFPTWVSILIGVIAIIAVCLALLALSRR